MKKSKKFLIVVLIISIITTSSYKQAKAFDFGVFFAITSCVVGTGFKVISKLVEKYSKPKNVSVGTQTFDSYLIHMKDFNFN